MDTLKRTPLYEVHLKYGGRIIPFGGWALPVQYAGIIEEHQAVREKAGLFDVSHMGEIEVRGPQALDLVQALVTNNAGRLQVNQVQYSPMCNERGGVIDDLLIYRLEDGFLLVVNAANTAKDREWARNAAARFPRVEVRDVSSETAQLALQGPLAQSILLSLTDYDLGRIKYYWFVPDVSVAGVNCLVSRTGYTGEDGFELYCRSEDAAALWERIMDAGRPHGLVPAGLGARDTLRLEACMPLYGHELDEETTPLEAGLGRFVDLEKPGFIGREALLEQQERGVGRKLAAFIMLERGVPRNGYPVKTAGSETGRVTSGSFSPSLEKNIGLAYIPAEYAVAGTEIDVVIRGKDCRAQVVKKPFYIRPK